MTTEYLPIDESLIDYCDSWTDDDLRRTLAADALDRWERERAAVRFAYDDIHDQDCIDALTAGQPLPQAPIMAAWPHLDDEIPF